MNWQDIKEGDWVLTYDNIAFKVTYVCDEDEDGNPYIYGSTIRYLTSEIKCKVQIKELP